MAELSEVIVMGAFTHWWGRTGEAIGSKPCFCVRDCLHGERAVFVPGEMIAAVVASWLSEFEAASPMVDALACAVSDGDWPSAYALADRLSVEVEVATA